VLTNKKRSHRVEYRADPRVRTSQEEPREPRRAKRAKKSQAEPRDRAAKRAVKRAAK